MYEDDWGDLTEEGLDQLLQAAKQEGDGKRAFTTLIQRFGVRATKQRCGWHYVSLFGSACAWDPVPAQVPPLHP
eukprot:1282608-Pyramimonas_sp.AAC.1